MTEIQHWLVELIYAGDDTLAYQPLGGLYSAYKPGVSEPAYR